MGKLMFARENYQQAVVCFERAKKPLEASISNAYHLRKVARLLQEGSSSRKEGFTEAANAFYDCAYGDHPQSQACYLSAGKCYAEAGRDSEASEAYWLGATPSTGNMPQQYGLTISQQQLAYNQSPSLLPHQLHQTPPFKPPTGSLNPPNLRIWDDMKGNRQNYWETVYNEILNLQRQYGDLVIPHPQSGNFLCRICNHGPLRRWDLSPHILGHASSQIKPWFSEW
jgi:tetratricopeptide (TPR) repeat protein